MLYPRCAVAAKLDGRQRARLTFPWVLKCGVAAPDRVRTLRSTWGRKARQGGVLYSSMKLPTIVVQYLSAIAVGPKERRKFDMSCVSERAVFFVSGGSSETLCGACGSFEPLNM